MTTARSGHLGAEYVTCRQGSEAALWEGVGVLLGLGLHTRSGFSALRSRGQAAAERLGEGNSRRDAGRALGFLAGVAGSRASLSFRMAAADRYCLELLSQGGCCRRHTGCWPGSDGHLCLAPLGHLKALCTLTGRRKDCFCVTSFLIRHVSHHQEAQKQTEKCIYMTYLFFLRNSY